MSKNLNMSHKKKLFHITCVFDILKHLFHLSFRSISYWCDVIILIIKVHYTCFIMEFFIVSGRSTFPLRYKVANVGLYVVFYKSNEAVNFIFRGKEFNYTEFK